MIDVASGRLQNIPARRTPLWLDIEVEVDVLKKPMDGSADQWTRLFVKPQEAFWGTSSLGFSGAETCDVL